MTLTHAELCELIDIANDLHGHFRVTNSNKTRRLALRIETIIEAKSPFALQRDIRGEILKPVGEWVLPNHD
jgi:hypothetical protein